MSLQVKQASTGLYQDTTTRTAAKMPAQIIPKRVLSFFHRLYPANWFSEFSHISITLEEFAPAKKALKPNYKKP